MTSDPKNDARHKQPIPGYEILDRIGSGGMGTIYKARQLSMNRIVALKVLKKSEIKDPLPLDRLRREALLIARMDHPNIVKGIDMGETDRYYYFTMDFIEGRSVKSILDLHAVMDELRAASIVREVARALQYAHRQKLTHRDIKPGNILISSSGQTKLTDLGLAKGESDLTITREGTTVGTPQYIAPEQARNPNAADIRSDIYSLGATFYHMVTGRMPFAGETMAEVLTKVLFSRPPLPEAVRPDVSHATSRVISRMMAKDPRRRYQTPGELADDLDVLIEALRDGSRELASLIGMNWKDSQRSRIPRRRTLVIASCAVVLAAAAAVFTLIKGGNDEGGSNGYTNSPVWALMAAYDAGEVKPGEALNRMAKLPPGFDPDQMEAFRSRLNRESRLIIDEILGADSPRFDRALAEGGFSDAAAAYRRIALADAVDALGIEPDRLPALLKAVWREKIDGAAAMLLKRIEEERATLFDQALIKLSADVEALRDRMNEGALDEAWAGILRLEETAGSYLDQAARSLSAQLAATTARASVDGRFFVEPSDRELFLSRIATVKDSMKADIGRAFTAAAEAHSRAVRQEALNLIREGDLDVMEEGLDALIVRAALKAGAKPVTPPAALDLDLPGPEALRDTLESTFETRLAELAARRKEDFRKNCLEQMDEYLFEGNFPAALAVLRDCARDPAADRSLLDRWRQRIELLGRLEAAALDALADWKGIHAQFKTRKGVLYTGEIRRVDRATGIISLELDSGQDLSLKFEELRVEEALDWIQKTRALEEWCMGLYAYARSELELAAGFLEKAEQFEDAGWYLGRITERLNQAAVAREASDRELRLALDEIDGALALGDWKQGERLLSTLPRRFGTSQGWSDTRRRRKEILERIEAERKQDEKRDRLNRLFSVPLDIGDDGSIRVAYPFDTREELKDFEAAGQGWSVMEGLLWCGAGQEGEGADYYHNNVGVRFGRAFDPQSPMRVAFQYMPPVEGRCPCFMGIAFFGQCLGIRSFPGGKHEGQVNAWPGDLDAYVDYFYFPDLGEDKPRKGKPQPFGFQRGERYEIELLWVPGRELLFKVDGRDIYRLPAFKPVGSGIEIKTLKKATVDNLTIEGKLKSD